MVGNTYKPSLHCNNKPILNQACAHLHILLAHAYYEYCSSRSMFVNSFSQDISLREQEANSWNGMVGNKTWILFPSKTVYSGFAK